MNAFYSIFEKKREIGSLSSDYPKEGRELSRRWKKKSALSLPRRLITKRAKYVTSQTQRERIVDTFLRANSARGNKPLSSNFPTPPRRITRTRVFPFLPRRYFPPQNNNKAKNKKQIREEKSRNPLSNDINAPSVGRNRRLDRRDDSARG